MLFKTNCTIYFFGFYAGDYCGEKNYKKRYNAEKKRCEGLENQLRDQQSKIACYQKEIAAKLKIIDDQKQELQFIRGKIKHLFDTTRVEKAETGQNKHKDDSRKTSTSSQPPAPRKAILISPPKNPIKVRII